MGGRAAGNQTSEEAQAGARIGPQGSGAHRRRGRALLGSSGLTGEGDQRGREQNRGPERRSEGTAGGVESDT